MLEDKPQEAPAGTQQDEGAQPNVAGAADTSMSDPSLEQSAALNGHDASKADAEEPGKFRQGPKSRHSTHYKVTLAVSCMIRPCARMGGWDSRMAQPVAWPAGLVSASYAWHGQLGHVPLLSGI